MSAQKPAFDDTYARMFGAAPPIGTAIGDSDADVLSHGRGFMEGFDLTLQLMVGCPAGCLFCYVKNGRFLTSNAAKGREGRDWGFRVFPKRNAVEKLARHVAKGTLADRTLYTSGVTDLYSSTPVITRAVWELLSNAPQPLRPRRIVVQTRFRPDRDVELIARYNSSTAPSDLGPPVVVSYSIGTDRDEVIRMWERATPSFEDRMRGVQTLCNRGVFVVVTLSPFGLWNDLRAALERMKGLGVAYTTALFFKEGTHSANTPKAFLDILHQAHPELLDPAWQEARVAEIASVFGPNRVLVGQDGFKSLACPQSVMAT